jgi:hypothetical protein
VVSRGVENSASAVLAFCGFDRGEKIDNERLSSRNGSILQKRLSVEKVSEKRGGVFTNGADPPAIMLGVTNSKNRGS